MKGEAKGMKPRIKDVVGLIGHYISDHWEAHIDREEISDELLHRGYFNREIKDAFHWIDEMTLGALRDAVAQNTIAKNPPSQRVLSSVESTKISLEAWSLLMSFYGRGLIDPMLLEEIMDHCMQMDVDEVTVTKMKEVTALTLFKHLHDEWKEFLHSSSTLLH